AGSDQIEDHADAPDESAEQSERVAGNGSSEKTGKTHGLSNERVFHEISVPDQTREQGAQREKNGNAVGTKCVAGGHRVRHEGGPEPHQNAGHDADDNTLFGDRAASNRQTAIGFSVHDHGDKRKPRPRRGAPHFPWAGGRNLKSRRRRARFRWQPETRWQARPYQSQPPAAGSPD